MAFSYADEPRKPKALTAASNTKENLDKESSATKESDYGSHGVEFYDPRVRPLLHYAFCLTPNKDINTIA